MAVLRIKTTSGHFFANWGSDGHFEVLNRSKSQLIQKLWHITGSGFQTRLAPQNDRLNLSFVKDIHVVGEKMTSTPVVLKRPFSVRKFWEPPSS
jgi:hypothetical protein